MVRLRRSSTPRTTTGITSTQWEPDVLDARPAARLIDNIVGHLLNAVSEPVIEYWRNVEKNLGDRVTEGVRTSRTRRTRSPLSGPAPPAKTAQAKAC